MKAVERLRANRQGIVAHKFNFEHVIEAFADVKLWLFLVSYCVTLRAKPKVLVKDRCSPFNDRTGHDVLR